MRDLPVIFVHTGNQKYLKIAIESAVRYANEVHLIGNKENEAFCSNWCNIDSLQSDLYEMFKKKYVHMSSNAYEFEVMCFKRYFVVYEYLKKISAKCFVMLDSDVLTYVNYETLPFRGDNVVAASWFGNQDNYKWAICPCVFVANVDALEDFLQFVIKMYSEEHGLEKLKAKMKYHEKNHIAGGICDMTLLYLWMEELIMTKKYEIYNNAIVDNDRVFDHNIQTANGYVNNEFKYDKILKMKKVEFVNGIPYFILQNGRRVRAYTLHFLGGAKTTMEAFYYEKAYVNKVIKRYKLRLLSSPKYAKFKLIKLLNVARRQNG